MLDLLYISVYNRLKKTLKRKASLLALYYISFVEISILFLLGVFFMAFANQMRLDMMSTTKALVVLCLVSVFIVFKNWMKYSGKKRHIINAKSKGPSIKVWQLILLPIACIGLGLVLLQSI